MAYHNERFISFLKRELAYFLERDFVRDEGVFLSVTDVRLTSAGDMANIFVSVFPKEKTAEVARSLKKSEKEARKYISSKLKSRKIPKINFLPDNSMENRVNLEKLLKNVENEE
ncbi:30S ribosome-binding factor RbfA [Candidatus Giovannonibacteria bacterium]|nr:30S ribosome-binding factor RbfA [Candidatus Giovannonibacteria bacterium]